jgi:hypothetical protein
MVCAIEDAGFEIRDTIMWIYGSGFPKSLDVSKAIDKAAGAEREVVGFHPSPASTARVQTMGRPEHSGVGFQEAPVLTAPATPEAERWAGWGTALKPAHEPIVVARKPLIGTVAANLLAHGVGALNIDASRIGTTEELGRNNPNGPYQSERTWNTSITPGQDSTGKVSGRWPANVILSHHPSCVRVGVRRVKGNARTNKDGKPETLKGGYHGGWGNPGNGWGDADGTETVSAWDCHEECAVAALDAQSGERPGFRTQTDRKGRDKFAGVPYGTGMMMPAGERQGFNDTGGASRFFLTVAPDLPIDGEDVTRCWLCEGLKHGIMNATQEVASCDHASTAASLLSPNGKHNGSALTDAPAPRLPGFEDSIPSSRTSALSAEQPLTSTPETIGSTVPSDAATTPDRLLAPRVKSAGDLCERCTIAIAQDIAGRLLDQSPVSNPGLDSITESRRSILTHNLASFVEPMVNTGIIPTTASLSVLFGSVRAAMRERTAVDLAVARDANGHDRTGSLPIDDPGLTRFLYKSKASRAERNAGLDGMPERDTAVHNIDGRDRDNGHNYIGAYSQDGGFNPDYRPAPRANHHPTVKPIALMRWLITLVTPKGGTVLDPFTGSGSTGCAAAQLGVDFIGIEAEQDYAAIAEARIKHWAEQAERTNSPHPQLPLFAAAD